MAMVNVADEIKKKVDIVQVISSYIPVKKAGRNFKANCPFHKEKSPSFFISPDRQIWHCFGTCNEGGDVISFLMKVENLTFLEAAQELSKRYGLNISFAQVDDAGLKLKDRFYSLNRLAADYYQYVLDKTDTGKTARDYLAERGIKPEIAQTFQIGYAPDSWESLMKYLLKKNYSSQELEQVGLTVKSSKSAGYDRFRGRLVFPIKDSRGNIIAFSGRVLKEDKDNPGSKYINTPETTIYHKRESLYGIYLAKDSIKKEGYVVLVEGEFDVIAPFQYGIENVVAVKGSAITSDQLMLLKRYCTRLVFALDADATGEEAVKRGTDEAEKLDFEIEVMVLDFAKDPDEAVRKDLVRFKKALTNRIPVYDFILSSLLRKYSVDDPFGKKQIADEMGAFIAKIQNPIVQSHYIKKTAETLGVSESSIQRSLYSNKKKFTQPRYVTKQQAAVVKMPREVIIQKYILGLLFQKKEGERLYDMIHEFDPEMFTVPSYKALFNEFLSFRKKHPARSIDEFSNQLQAELVPVFNELYLFASYEEESGYGDFTKTVYELQRNMYKRMIQELMMKEEDGDDKEEPRLKELTASLTEVEKKLSLL
jgi:DNA primase